MTIFINESHIVVRTVGNDAPLKDLVRILHDDAPLTTIGSINCRCSGDPHEQLNLGKGFGLNTHEVFVLRNVRARRVIDRNVINPR